MSAGYSPLPTRPSPGDPRDVDAPSLDDDDSVDDVLAVAPGVRTVQAALQAYGRSSRWGLFSSLALAAYVYSLDSSTTPAYLTFAASSFGQHGLIGALGVVQSLTVAVGKPVIAKAADVSSRGKAYLAVLFSYVLGEHRVLGRVGAERRPRQGTSSWLPLPVSLSWQAASFYHSQWLLVGVPPSTRRSADEGLPSGLQLLNQIIIADITTLAWRGFVVGLSSAPFLLNAYVGPNLSAIVIGHLGWRWGYGMFAIMVPLALAPLIITLLSAESKAKKMQHHRHANGLSSSGRTIKQRLLRASGQLDLVGLLLLGTAISLILLPLTRNKSPSQRLGSSSTIPLLVVGSILLGVFVYWNMRVASRPVIPPHLAQNKTVVLGALIGFFDFMSFFLTFAYLYSFVLVVKPWSLVNATYFMQIQTVGLAVSGIIAGIAMHCLRSYKYVLVFGLTVRLVGVTLMLHSRGAESSDAELVSTQVLQGLGGGLAAVAFQVSSQASVLHADLAVTTAVLLLFTEAGGAVGNAGAGWIWSNTMPRNLAKHLPWLPSEQRAELYGNITYVTSLPRDDPVRLGVVEAYGDTMKVMVVSAMVFSVLPLLLAMGMPDWYLGDRQSAVEIGGEEECLVDHT